MWSYVFLPLFCCCVLFRSIFYLLLLLGSIYVGGCGGRWLFSVTCCQCFKTLQQGRLMEQGSCRNLRDCVHVYFSLTSLILLYWLTFCVVSSNLTVVHEWLANYFGLACNYFHICSADMSFCQIMRSNVCTRKFCKFELYTYVRTLCLCSNFFILLCNINSIGFYAKVCFYADRKSTRLNSSHSGESRMPSSA